MTDPSSLKKGSRWSKGQSGNPKGRPAGIPNRATILAQEMLDGDGEEIVRKAIDMAKAGDQTALRLCIERLFPVRKDRPITLELPKVAGASDLAAVVEAIISGVASGEITPSEGAALSNMLETQRRVLETSELAARIEAIEKRFGDGAA